MTATERVAELLTETDAYKLSHVEMREPGLEYVYSNFTARGTRVPYIQDGTVFFGLQAFLQVLNARWSEFFALSAHDLEVVLGDYQYFVGRLLGKPEDEIDDEHWRVLHSIGYLPLRIRAIREGSVVPLRVPYFTIENTDPRVPWLTNYLETTLSANLWQPITSATLSWATRRMLNQLAMESSSTPEAVDFQMHDFSYRGMENDAAAAASGAGHLISSLGTDTLPSIRYIDRYYDAGNGVVGMSVPASEHSIMTAVGPDGEFQTFERLIDLYPNGIVSLVSDSFDFWSALQNFMPRLKDKIMARNGRVVLRPDSGVPELILCGDPEAPEGSPARRGAIDILGEVFGYTVNDKGYKELDPHIGLIYGDGITHERAESIVKNMMSQGWASTNVVFGFGSYTFQYQSRDTFMMAMKATWVQVNGEPRNIFKDPITDNGDKKSARGRLAVRRQMSGIPYLIQEATPEQEENQDMETVFENGVITRHQSFADVRAQLKRDTEVLDRMRVSEPEKVAI